ncbi:hypothetical protein GCM10022226_62920 [Sphaerisporangium flaviroseum]|uniref:Uncharacterized protein n=1 Tax=Sphaerisporangium flaviroseum TaxID=509199 RepID=A0ABP7J3C8_9ACTN
MPGKRKERKERELAVPGSPVGPSTRRRNMGRAYGRAAGGGIRRTPDLASPARRTRRADHLPWNGTGPTGRATDREDGTGPIGQATDRETAPDPSVRPPTMRAVAGPAGGSL